MKIAIAGIGYDGLSNAILLAQRHDVVALDLSEERVRMVNAQQSPLVDPEIEGYLAEKELSLSATTYPEEAYAGLNSSSSPRPRIEIPKATISTPARSTGRSRA